MPLATPIGLFGGSAVTTAAPAGSLFVMLRDHHTAATATLAQTAAIRYRDRLTTAVPCDRPARSPRARGAIRQSRWPLAPPSAGRDRSPATAWESPGAGTTRGKPSRSVRGPSGPSDISRRRQDGPSAGLTADRLTVEPGRVLHLCLEIGDSRPDLGGRRRGLPPCRPGDALAGLSRPPFASDP
jgi:hypothetical protein